MNPVVLLHGFATSSDRTWQETGLADLLADAGREVLALDLLGHGRAPKPHEPEAYARLEADVADRLPDGAVDGIGFSLGGQVLLRLAAQEPSRFGRLVVAGVGANLFRDEGGEHIARAIEGGGGDDDPVTLHFAQLAAGPGNDPAALAACMRRPREPVTPAALAKVECPVLVVLGDRDFAGPAGPLVDALPDATLVTLPGCDHFATVKQFGFIDAALDFLGAQPA